MTWFRRHYGAGPAHLVLLLASFAFAGYVSTQIAQVPAATHVAIWFVGAVLFHDLVLWPVYAVADRVVTGSEWLRQRRSSRPPRVPWVNHVRVPAVLSGALLTISFPLVFNWSGQTYRSATGLSPSPYTAHWLFVTAVLFGASAALYLGRVGWVLARNKAPAQKRARVHG